MINLFFKKYNLRTYNCYDFVLDAWRALTSEELNRRDFKKSNTPSGLCVVVMNTLTGTSHTGILLNGKLLHISEDGVKYELFNVVKFKFKNIRYYVK